MWDEITHPFPNCNGCTLELKLNHVSKRGPVKMAKPSVINVVDNYAYFRELSAMYPNLPRYHSILDSGYIDCFEIPYDSGYMVTAWYGIAFCINCPACRTTLVATRFWVVMICPIIKCLTVLRDFFDFVWFVFIHHNFQFYFELCTYCNILDIYLSQNLNFVNYLLFYMKLLNYLFFNMFGSVLECCELTGVSLLWPWLIKWK